MWCLTYLVYLTYLPTHYPLPIAQTNSYILYLSYTYNMMGIAIANIQGINSYPIRTVSVNCFNAMCCVILLAGRTEVWLRSILWTVVFVDKINNMYNTPLFGYFNSVNELCWKYHGRRTVINKGAEDKWEYIFELW